MRQALGGLSPAILADHFELFASWLGGTMLHFVGAILVSFPVFEMKYSDKGNLKDEGIILAHSSRHNPWVRQVH